MARRGGAISACFFVAASAAARGDSQQGASLACENRACRKNAVVSALADVCADRHILRMTDDTGIFQHAIYSIPDLAKGYTADDNARALVLAVQFYEADGQPRHLALLYRYLAFILYAQNPSGYFRNFMTYDRNFTETQGSEECFGRCLWALAFTLAAKKAPEGVKAACAAALARALPHIASLRSLRGQAYAVVGLDCMGDEASGQHSFNLATAMSERFEMTAGSDWRWFEDILTYDNALLPWAMFAAFQKTGQARFLRVARDSLAFLDATVFRNGYLQPIGCKGWWKRRGAPALYDQQPIEASVSVLAHIAAYRATGDAEFLALAEKSLEWYTGANSRGESLIDADTGACCDGITAEGINRNQGAESVVGYHVARMFLADCRGR